MVSSNLDSVAYGFFSALKEPECSKKDTNTVNIYVSLPLSAFSYRAVTSPSRCYHVFKIKKTYKYKKF